MRKLMFRDFPKDTELANTGTQKFQRVILHLGELELGHLCLWEEDGIRKSSDLQVSGCKG